MARGGCLSPTANDIAQCVLDTYDKLPKKCKPLERDSSSREWVPLSGIVLARNGSEQVECVALGTGMKCLPASKLSIAQGNVLHDSHAEIIAIRAFNRFLLDQCHLLVSSQSSAYVRVRSTEEVSQESPQPFAINDDITIHMYGSEAPCGDASMELVMAAQDDATPWLVTGQSDDTTILKGRGSFAELGIVRRKPARPDAPLTLSKSCTDKLAMYQFTSVLGPITSMLVASDRAFISTLTIPNSQYVDSAIRRAFSGEGRLKGPAVSVDDHPPFQPFTVRTTSLDFAWSRRAVEFDQKAVARNASAVYVSVRSETLINGVLQGRKMGDPRGASMICRRSMWSHGKEIIRSLNHAKLTEAMESKRYKDLKSSALLDTRRTIKGYVKTHALRGWTRNQGDDEWGIA